MKWIAALSAFVMYGAWSCWVNSQSGDPAWLRAGLLQGGYAFCSTLLLRALIIVLYRYFKTKRNGRLLSYFAGLMFIVAIPYGIHWLSGTFNIIAAIAPGVIAGQFYIIFVLLFEARKNLCLYLPAVSAKPS